MNMKKLIALAAAVVVAFGICLFQVGWIRAKADDQLATCWVMCKPGSRVTVRMTPSKKGVELGWLECGDDFLTDGESRDGWIRCYGIGETAGWVYAGYVCTSKPETIGERYVCVAKKQVACRKWIGGPKIDQRPWLKNGQNVQVFASDGEWAITSRGYIKAEYLEADPE